MKKTYITQEYINLLSAYQPSLANYYNKEIDCAVKLKNGAYFEIEKSRIKTSFCFGYGYCGVTNHEEMKDAHEQAESARTSVKAFLSENLEKLNNLIEDFKNVNNKIVGVYQYGASNIKRMTKSIFQYEGDFMSWYRNSEMYIIDEEERASIMKALEDEKEAFTKRLNTYLKKFGLSKLNVWTYLVD